MSYTIYVSDVKNKKWLPVTTVPKSENIFTTFITDLGILTKRISATIECLEDDKLTLGIYSIKVKNLEFVLLDSLKYRRGSVYYGIQYSADKIHHDGGGVSTNPIDQDINVTMDLIKEDLIKYFSKNNSSLFSINSGITHRILIGDYIVGI